MRIQIVLRIAVLLLLAGVEARTQTGRQPIFNHPLNFYLDRTVTAKSPALASQPETTRVLVARIAFQEDNNPGTTGKGSFDFSATARVVDPTPHDKAYVQNHMTFLENYFRRVSDGKEIVLTTVLDSIYRVSHEMAYYSPLRTSTNNIELGRLVEDAWKKVDSVSPGIPYEQYQAFIILHAGVGRDIDLVSLYGYDPAPFDLPSLYLNLPALKKMFGSSYNGVQVRDSVTFIKNSMIIPETESRVLPTITGSALLPLGINGLLVASFGSYLGLPDLFDTKTGRSGIGRFGLMDGQSIFSWNGVFPPEPSAWEKYFLRWIDPIAVASADSVVSIPAVTLNHAVDSVYRVPITAKEYFLLENRNRDANRDNANITVVYNGTTTVRSWARDTAGFNAFFQDSLYGVVTDVDEFDFSLPGAIDPNTNEWFDGGLLIWHIDENVIDAGYASDRVNADPNHRGVNLEEADGSQDIGQAYPFLTPGYGSEDGTRLDFWYAGNSAPLRHIPNGNVFTATSQPSSMSNDRANSHITIKDFSHRAPRMTARIQVGDQQIRMLAGFPKNLGRRVGNHSLTAMNVSGGSYSSLLIATNEFGADTSAAPLGHRAQEVGQSKLFGWNTDGSPLLSAGNASGLLALSGGIVRSFIGKAAVGEFNGDSEPEITIASRDNPRFIPPGVDSTRLINTWSLTDQNNDFLADSLFKITTSRNVLTSPVVSDSFIAYGASHSTIYLVRYDGSMDSVELSQTDTSDIVSLSLYQNPGSFIAVTANGTVGLIGIACIQIQQVLVSSTQLAMTVSYAIAGTISSSQGQHIVLATRDGKVSLVVPCTFRPLSGFPVFTDGEIANAPAFADIDGDGQKDIIVFSGNKIYAINATGAILDNFPVTVSTSSTILSSPIVADIDGDGNSDIVAVTREGLVVAYDKNGKMLDGFPLQAGINNGSTPAAFYMPSDCLSCTEVGLAVASDDGSVYAWHTGTLRTGVAPPPKQPWPQYMHDAQNTGLNETTLTLKQKSGEFFPAAMAYNWPNPVGPEHGFKTHIRYYLHDNASVSIKIFDLAGDLVTEFKGPGTGGLDNEIEWDVSSIQSGVYFAHIDAQGAGASGSAIIKIAVVK